MSDQIIELYEDFCLPFQIDGQDIKGRIVRLGPSLDRILKKHNYPDHVSRTMGKSMVLTALLGSMMKYEGILTTQMKGDGQFRLLVSDYAKGEQDLKGIIRGYAGFNDDLEDIPSLSEQFGNGAYLAITMDQGKFMERYQGIVKLDSDTVTEVAEEYFKSSEQLPTKIMISCDKDKTGKWQAAAIMIQHLARNTEDEYSRDDEATEDNWNTASILLSSLKDEELLDKSLSLPSILIRLYHETSVRIFEATRISDGCRCSEEKIRTALASLKVDELKEVAEDGIITVTCDFCTKNHKFDLAKLMH